MKLKCKHCGNTEEFYVYASVTVECRCDENGKFVDKMEVGYEDDIFDIEYECSECGANVEPIKED